MVDPWIPLTPDQVRGPGKMLMAQMAVNSTKSVHILRHLRSKRRNSVHSMKFPRTVGVFALSAVPVVGPALAVGCFFGYEVLDAAKYRRISNKLEELVARYPELRPLIPLPA